MQKTTFGLSWVLFCAVLAGTCDAAVRVGNLSRSYADSYNQVNAQRQATEAAAQQQHVATTGSADTTLNLPVRVANNDLAMRLSQGMDAGDVTIENLDRCAMIYPNGEFAWDKPYLGRGMGTGSTCVAVVEMRGYQMGPNGSDVVLARSNLAAGDAVKCNISEFPVASYTTSASEIVFPADEEPTIEDVKAVMNQEQKQNAGLKIAAGAILMGLAGNAMGDKEVGSDKLFGTNKAKLKTTAVGALGGAAMMTANSFGGKVGGDIALSVGTNAVAGAITGNIMAGGNSVLRIEPCVVNDQETSCLWGTLNEAADVESTNTVFIKIDGATLGEVYICNQNKHDCKQEQIISGLIGKEKMWDILAKLPAEYENWKLNLNEAKYDLKDADTNINTKHMESATHGAFVQVNGAQRSTRKIPALVAGVENTMFGLILDDWKKMKDDKKGELQKNLYGRNNAGNAYDLTAAEDKKLTIDNFTPMMLDASDGGLVDLDNRARAKQTLIGAGAGGALGGVSAYQGAQDDIENRWVTAVREYKDSLQKVYCVTGDRFLGYYNDVIMIPEMIQPTE